jgi:hypothetical protein
LLTQPHDFVVSASISFSPNGVGGIRQIGSDADVIAAAANHNIDPKIGKIVKVAGGSETF